MTTLCFTGYHKSCAGCDCTCHVPSLFDDYPLYDGTPPHVGGDTSTDAAESIRKHVGPLHRQVLKRIEPDATCDEVEVATGLAHQTASARIRELVQLGLIYDTGKRRPTRSGRQARVYARC